MYRAGWGKHAECKASCMHACRQGVLGWSGALILQASADGGGWGERGVMGEEAGHFLAGSIICLPIHAGWADKLDSLLRKG